jgi:carbonic anhydrase
VAYKAGALTIHGWVLDISSGLIKDLAINFEETLEAIREIYRLT